MEAAASIIGILQLSDKVIEYGNTAKGAKTDWPRLRGQIRACNSLLIRLKDQSEDSEDGQNWSETMKNLKCP